MSEEFERLLAQYAGVNVNLGPKQRPQADFSEDTFVEGLRAMQGRQNTRFKVVVGAVAVMFALVLAFSWSNHFSVEIAKIAIGAGGVVSVLSTLLLRSVWRDYTVIDLVLTTLPMIAPKERKGFVLAILTSLREGHTQPSTVPQRTVHTV